MIAWLQLRKKPGYIEIADIDAIYDLAARRLQFCVQLYVTSFAATFRVSGMRCKARVAGRWYNLTIYSPEPPDFGREEDDLDDEEHLWSGFWYVHDFDLDNDITSAEVDIRIWLSDGTKDHGRDGALISRRMPDGEFLTAHQYYTTTHPEAATKPPSRLV